MATFLANKKNTTGRYTPGPAPHVQIMFPWKDKKMQGIRRHFFWDVYELTIKESQTPCDITRCIEK